MAIYKLPPRTVLPSAAIADAVWNWCAWEVGGGVTLDEVEGFLRGKLGLDETDTAGALAAFVKTASPGGSACSFAVRGARWTPTRSEVFGLKGVTFAEAQEACATARAMPVIPGAHPCSEPPTGRGLTLRTVKSKSDPLAVPLHLGVIAGRAGMAEIEWFRIREEPRYLQSHYRTQLQKKWPSVMAYYAATM